MVKPLSNVKPSSAASAELAVSVNEDWIAATLIVSVDTCDERLAVDSLARPIRMVRLSSTIPRVADVDIVNAGNNVGARTRT